MHTHLNDFYSPLILPEKTMNITDIIWSNKQFTCVKTNYVLLKQIGWFSVKVLAVGQWCPMSVGNSDSVIFPERKSKNHKIEENADKFGIT